MTPPIPPFIKYNGCINCPVCKENKKRHGTDYGSFDHELMASCVIEGCEMWGHSLVTPFITPSEIRRLANACNDETKAKAERIASTLEKELEIAAWVK
jgi:hypothetical protein